MLELTFLNGDTKTFPFGPDSQLSVQTPDGANGIKSGSWGEITGLTLVPDAPAEVTPTPEPQPVADPASVVFQANVVTTAGDTISVTQAPGTAASEEDSPVEPVEAIEDPTPAVSESSAEPTSDTGSDPSPEPVEHDTAVTEANDAIVAVGLGTSDPGSLAKALSDVTAALETHPDSAELQDAKTQLTELSEPSDPPAAA